MYSTLPTVSWAAICITTRPDILVTFEMTMSTSTKGDSSSASSLCPWSRVRGNIRRFLLLHYDRRDTSDRGWNVHGCKFWMCKGLSCEMAAAGWALVPQLRHRTIPRVVASWRLIPGKPVVSSAAPGLAKFAMISPVQFNFYPVSESIVADCSS